MADIVEVIVDGPTSVVVDNGEPQVVVADTPGTTVVEVAAAVGPIGPGNLFVQSNDPNMTFPGLWIQTGLGSDGAGFTFWIEDGV